MNSDAACPQAIFFREWLNPPGSDFTSSVVAFHGLSEWTTDGVGRPATFLEIADCHCKVRLHRANSQPLSEFVVKLIRLRGVLDRFILELQEVDGE